MCANYELASKVRPLHEELMYAEPDGPKPPGAGGGLFG